MQNSNRPVTRIMAAGAICFLLADSAWSQQGCVDPSLVYPDPSSPTDSSLFIFPGDTTEYSIPNPSISEFGSNLTCGDIDGQFGGVIPNGIGRQTFYDDVEKVQFTVVSTVFNGIANWGVVSPTAAEVRTDVNGIPYTVLPAIDTSITDAAQGGNGCLATHISDAVQGQLAYRKSNGTTTLRNLYVCSDNNFDALGFQPPPSAPPVEGCELDNGEVIDIYGVTIECTGVPPGEQRTIIVSKDTESDGAGGVQPVPGYGFIGSQGVIHFENVCICNGPDPINEIPQCNPNPEGTYVDPALAGLPPCEVGENTRVGVNVEILNPRCITVGGRRSCY